VLASDQADVRASFSNYGATTVNIAAPGTNILSTIWDRALVQQEVGGSLVPGSSSSCVGNPATCMASTIFSAAGMDCVGSNCRWGFQESGGNLFLFGDTTFPGGVSYSTLIDGTIGTAGQPTTTPHVVLRYYAAWDLECNSDYVDVQVFNGTTWETLSASSYNLSVGCSTSHTLSGRMFPAYSPYAAAVSHDITSQVAANSGTAQIAFHFVSNGTPNNFSLNGGVQIINVTIDEQGATPAYDLFMGTSMASPMVAGVAALVLSAPSPPTTPAELKTRILSTGEPIAGLHCLVSSSKRVDAFAAVQNTTTANPDNSDCAAPVVATAGGGGGGCLITWATEDWLPRDALQPLRDVREWLWQQGPWGRALVRGYYRASAGIIAWLRGVRAQALAQPHTAAI
jgi:subtilisin family serine protease